MISYFWNMTDDEETCVSKKYGNKLIKRNYNQSTYFLML